MLDPNLDTILKSPVSQFDCFPSDNFLEASVNDGESIVELKTFADRILQFKERTLYIINISGDYEFLESKHSFLGITKRYHVTDSENGIIWINRFGCYIYSGEGAPTNLSQDKLSDLTWQSFFNENSMVGYIATSMQIVIFKGTATIRASNIFSCTT